MSTISNAFNNWLQRQNASVMRQEATIPPHMKIGVRETTGIAFLYHEDTSSKELKKLGIRPATEGEIGKYWELKPLFEAHKIQKIQLAEPITYRPNPAEEATVCEAFPEHTREAMIGISVDSASKEREMGAAITRDYTLGKVMTGMREKVLIPRPEGTIGTFHTHVAPPIPFPGVQDTLETIKHSDKIMCIGATGAALRTKIQCFTPNKPEWDELQFKFRLLVDDINDYNTKVGAKFKGTAPEILLKVARTEPYWYREGKELQERRNDLEGRIKAQLRELATPEEWEVSRWVDGFKDVPFFEAHPNMFSKCKIIWETFEEEKPRLPVLPPL